MYHLALRAEVMNAMAEDKLHIRLHVYDTEIPVNVRREDEFYYREAAKLINTTVNTYADLFKGRKSEKEVLYMAMIDIALRYEKEKGNKINKNSIERYNIPIEAMAGIKAGKDFV